MKTILTNIPAPPAGGRLIFLDNLRSAMVIVVMIFHSAAGYSSKVAFWPFHDPNPTFVADLIMLLGDVFMMAILFFIAGFFAEPSLARGGSVDFLRRKLRRLGIPWLVVTLFVLPPLDYLQFRFQSRSSGLPVRSYLAHVCLSLKQMTSLPFGWLNMTRYLDMTEQFYQRYMWFLSLLLFFFVLFAMVRVITRRKSVSAAAIPADHPPCKSTTYAVVAACVSLIILLFALVRFSIYPDFFGFGWFTVGNLIEFQWGKLVIYAGLFIMGGYAYRHGWFTTGNFTGWPWVWGLACFVLFGVNITFMKLLNTASSQLLALRIGFVIAYPLWVMCFLGWFLALFRKYFNRPTRFNRLLADNSYRMYIVHYAIPMTLPLLICDLPLSAPVKLVVVSFATIVLSYGISRYLLKFYLKKVVLGLVLFSIILGMAT